MAGFFFIPQEHEASPEVCTRGLWSSLLMGSLQKNVELRTTWSGPAAFPSKMVT